MIVSGLLSPGGAPGRVLAHWGDGRFEAITCGALVSEVADVLARPHIHARIGAGARMECVDFLVNHSRFVPDVVPQAFVPGDPDDDYLVTLARECGAALVTGDRHLLDLRGMPAVMGPARFLAILGGESRRH